MLLDLPAILLDPAMFLLDPSNWPLAAATWLDLAKTLLEIQTRLPDLAKLLLYWPALSDGRTGEGVFGRFPRVLVDFGSF